MVAEAELVILTAIDYVVFGCKKGCFHSPYKPISALSQIKFKPV
jgi:hypothetical protein